MLNTPITDVIAKLSDISPSKTALVGFDGYIDKIQTVVEKQNRLGELPQLFESLDSFGSHVRDAAGLSTQLTVRTEKKKLGGNGPIMAHALATLGIENTCIGPFGVDEILSPFLEMHPQCRLINLGQSAETIALEFLDGKLILSDTAPFDCIDWNHLKKVIGIQQLAGLTGKCDLISLVDWSNLAHANTIWKGILEELLIPLDHRPMVFFDLSDPGKRHDDEITQALEIISAFGRHTKTILGLNGNEALKIYHALEKVSNRTESDSKDFEHIGRYIFGYCKLDQLVIHPIDCAYVVSKNGCFLTKGSLVREPKILTGGGDNFNAGYCLGQLLSCSEVESSLLAMAASGSYIQNGHSGDQENLKQYLKSGGGQVMVG